jgi:hypothetical protein
VQEITPRSNDRSPGLGSGRGGHGGIVESRN